MKNMFFYGSLRSSFWNNKRVISEDSKLIAAGKTLDNFRLFVQGGFVPCAVPDSGGYPLLGELWNVSDEDAQRVHHLESGYKHKDFSIDVDGKTELARIYFCDTSRSSPYWSREEKEETTGDYDKVKFPKGMRG